MKTMQAFVWGCAIGVFLGVLYAPKRGEETRADLQHWLNEWQGQAQHRLTEVREKATKVIEQAEQRVDTAPDNT
ncbi:MAG TPA: YtxH domain-containing protein [Ktedonobacterales bacterium]|nr:YtxH domain-containing protein [Ktedonobacterales bacterium]